jgi:serine/threonine protein kinase
MTSIVGSPIYMAPQILRGEKYNSKCDVWSFGILIF